MEARIWLLAAADALLLVLVGCVANLYRRGVYVSCARRDRARARHACTGSTSGRAHHTLRYPYGMDLIRESVDVEHAQPGPVGGARRASPR